MAAEALGAVAAEAKDSAPYSFRYTCGENPLPCADPAARLKEVLAVNNAEASWAGDTVLLKGALGARPFTLTITTGDRRRVQRVDLEIWGPVFS